MRGSFIKNYAMFAKLCGDDAMKHVILVTTKWAKVELDEGEMREEQLKMEFWKETLNKGAITERFTRTHESAWNIVNQLVARSVPKDQSVDDRALQIQTELVALGRSLPETEAGKTLRKYLQDALKQYEKTSRDQLKARKGSDGRQGGAEERLLETERQLREAEMKLQSILKQVEELKIPIGKRIRAFFGLR
jgi:hypothetical protein